MALPLLAFAVPAAVGHPVLLGDDLTQNEPLRILVGQDLRAGHLPLFDPYLWSGAPLLAGWNAGAAYPLTWLFAVLPATAAWTAGLVVTWWVAGLSLYGFLRHLRLEATASVLGALSFVFSGAFLAQVVHVGLVEGMSWVPLQLLAISRIVAGGPGGTRLRWAVVLGAAFGATMLAGEPRAIDDAAVVVAVFAAWRLVRLGRAGLAPLGWVVIGLAAGVGLGAAQWLPGIEAVGGSQRAAASLSLFASGSLPDRWLTLLLVPDLLGGSGSLHQPAFLAGYNLTEVAGYVGALPLVGGLALLGRIRRGRPVPPWLVWDVLALGGVVLALGINTPLGHLLARLPFYGAQRLQSRNLVVADLALAVLTGYVVDDLVGPGGGARDGGLRRERRRSALLAGVGAAAVAAPVVVLAVWGDGFLEALRVPASRVGMAARLLPEAAPFAVFGVLAATAIVVVPRLRPGRARGVLGVLVGANLVAVAGLVVVAIPPSSPSGASGRAGGGTAQQVPASAVGTTGPVRPVAALGLGGRFAIYDPDLLEGGELTALGTPDGNVVAGTPSALGYGSIVAARYARATGSHGATGGGQDVLAPAAAADGVLDELDTRSLLTLPGYLLTPVGGGGSAPGIGTGARRLGAGAPATWYFGEPLALSSVAVPRLGPGPGGGLRVGLVAPDGRTRWWRPPVGPDPLGVAVRAARPFVAVALRVVGATGTRLGTPRLTTTSGAVLLADGQLQAAVVPPRWRYAGRDGAFAVFADRRAASPLRLQALPGRPLGAARLTGASGPPAAPDAVRVTSPHGAVVVRSVSALAGWGASWQPAGSLVARPLRVRRHGLVQAVRVPPGAGLLRFAYGPPGFVVGATLSLVALALLVAGGALSIAGRRPGRAAGEVDEGATVEVPGR